MRKLRNIALLLVAFSVTLVVCLCLVYKFGIGSVDSSNNKTVLVEIKEGKTTKEIAKTLKEKKLIKNEIVFMVYLKLNNINDLKGGFFELKQSMNVEKIVETLRKNSTIDPNAITILFKEGLNIRQIASVVEKETNNTKEDFLKLIEDENYIDSLIEKYWFLTDDIKHPNIYYPLEGYLFPNTYTFKNKDVKVSEIVSKMLDEMELNLKPYKSDIEKNKYSVHEIMTLASISELEGTNLENRKDIIGVFINRLSKNMNIGSDVTTYYAFKVDMEERDLTTKEINTYNAYNTRGPNMYGKLPIGPITNSGNDAITAAIYPNTNDYLYFVADKDRNIYFTKTQNEHDKKVNELKKKGLWFTW